MLGHIGRDERTLGHDLEALGADCFERTAHELALEPILYWLPLARWIVQHQAALSA